MEYRFIVAIAIIAIAVPHTYAFFSYWPECNFNCANVTTRPVCAINTHNEMVLLPHKCYFKELMCNELKKRWRFTKKKCKSKIFFKIVKGKGNKYTERNFILKTLTLFNHWQFPINMSSNVV